MAVELADLDGLLQDAGAAGADRFDAIARFVLDRFDRSAWELSVSFVGDGEMQRLNGEWRGKDRTTDVLSFSQVDAVEDDAFAEAPDGAARELGDVVISVPRAVEQAREGGWTVDEELARLLLHGILHLLGFDHEGDEEEAQRMRSAESDTAYALVGAGLPCASEAR